MTVTVVTGWSPQGYEEYGKRFLNGFYSHWPESVNLLVYGEERVRLERGKFIELNQVGSINAFLSRHADNEYVHGTSAVNGWKNKDYVRGYSFRFDAYKFFRMAMIPWQAYQITELDTTHLIWIDADVATSKDIPEGFIESLLPDSCNVAYLGRQGYHSETGFVLFRVPQAELLIKAWHDVYHTDRFLNLREWHSAFVFDRCLDTIPGVAAHNLTPNNKIQHVFVESPLNPYMDHLKGPRKGLAESPERSAARRYAKNIHRIR